MCTTYQARFSTLWNRKCGVSLSVSQLSHFTPLLLPAWSPPSTGAFFTPKPPVEERDGGGGGCGGGACKISTNRRTTSFWPLSPSHSPRRRKPLANASTSTISLPTTPSSRNPSASNSPSASASSPAPDEAGGDISEEHEGEDEDVGAVKSSNVRRSRSYAVLSSACDCSSLPYLSLSTASWASRSLACFSLRSRKAR